MTDSVTDFFFLFKEHAAVQLNREHRSISCSHNYEWQLFVDADVRLSISFRVVASFISMYISATRRSSWRRFQRLEQSASIIMLHMRPHVIRPCFGLRCIIIYSCAARPPPPYEPMPHTVFVDLFTLLCSRHRLYYNRRSRPARKFSNLDCSFNLCLGCFPFSTSTFRRESPHRERHILGPFAVDFTQCNWYGVYTVYRSVRRAIASRGHFIPSDVRCGVRPNSGHVRVNATTSSSAETVIILYN